MCNVHVLVQLVRRLNQKREEKTMKKRLDVGSHRFIDCTTKAEPRMKIRQTDFDMKTFCKYWNSLSNSMLI